MRIGFDAKRIFLNETGLGVYSRLLVQNLTSFFPQHEYFLFTPRVNSDSFHEKFRKSPFHVITPSIPYPGWRTFGMGKAIYREGIELYHGLSHEIPVGVSSSRCRKIVTIHDAVFMRYPEFFPVPDRQLYLLKWRHSCSQADMLIAVSENTREDLIRYFNIRESRVKVIYQTCDPLFYEQVPQETKDEIRSVFSLPGEFMLYVGSIIRRKNLLSIVQAMQRIPPHLRIPLVIVGTGKGYKKKVQEYIAEHKLNKTVFFIDKVANSELPAIYQLARIFIYPSHYEGFGIPILESLASKTPVVTSSTSSMPEAGGPGAVLIDPGDIDSIAEGIASLLEDQALYESCILKGFQHAQSFTGERQATETMQLYNQIMQEE